MSDSARRVAVVGGGVTGLDLPSRALRPGEGVTLTARVLSEFEDQVFTLELDGRQLILVGTAHISRESVDLVRQVIEQERPDRVCVELDERRSRGGL